MNSRAQKEKLLGTMLVIWFNIEIYIVILENCLTNSLLGTLARYSTYLALFFVMLFIEKRRIDRSMFLFSFMYLGIVVFNIVLVTYRRYAIVEGICSFLSYLPMLVIVSSRNFNLENTFHQWYKACCINTVTLIFVLILYLKGTVSYGVISVVTYTNVVILYYLYILKLEKKRNLLLLLFFNFAVGLFWGSRMPSVAAAITMVIMFFYYGKFTRKKTLFLVTGILGVSVVFIFLFPLLNTTIAVLNEFGLSSRSLELLIKDYGNKNLIEMSQSSGREYIWDTVSAFLKSHWILPNGFGAIRALTNGKYYYSHNIFFDFIVVGGVFSIILILIVFIKLKNASHNYTAKEYFLVLAFLLFFFIRSLTGASFLSDKYFVLSVALLFLYKKGTK